MGTSNRARRQEMMWFVMSRERFALTPALSPRREFAEKEIRALNP
jgi:hypothetical protein